MKTIGRFAIALLLIAFTGCRVYDWWYYREYRAIKERLFSIRGLTFIETWGNEDVTFEDIYARVRLRSGEEIVFAQLSVGAFNGSKTFFVIPKTTLHPKVTTYGHNGVFWTATGEPVNSVSYSSLNFGGASTQLCCPEVRTVEDVVNHYPKIAREVNNWPSCPDFIEWRSPAGKIYRYCRGASEESAGPGEEASWHEWRRPN